MKRFNLVLLLITLLINASLSISSLHDIPHLKKGTTYLAYSLGITGSGKSTIFDAISQYVSSKPCINLINHSTDNIRTDLALEMVAKQEAKDYSDAITIFNTDSKVNQRVYDVFDEKLLQMLHDFKRQNNDKINIIYLDRNMHFANLDTIFKIFPKELFEFIVFIPKSNNKLNFLPFSLDYIVQCFNRVKNRDHPTLNEKVDKQYFLTVLNHIKKNKGQVTDAFYKNKIVIDVTATDESRNVDESADGIKAKKFLEDLITSPKIKSFTDSLTDEVKTKVFYLVYYFLNRFNEGKDFKNTAQVVKREVYEFLDKAIQCPNKILRFLEKNLDY